MTVETYIKGINEIYDEKPQYALGHDGSDGLCDCIGMVKGAIKRGGGNPSGLSGTNYAARHTIKNLASIPGSSVLAVGDVVLKGRQPGDKGYNLPDKYKSGSDLTDYYHIGTVTRQYPLEITHMTTPTAKKDTKLGQWAYYGQLPQVDGDSPTPTPEPGKGIVYAKSGKTVNMRRAPSVGAALVERVPIGSTVDILGDRDGWDNIRWQGKTGWMMKEFIVTEMPAETVTVVIPGLTRDEAKALCAEYPQAEISVG